MTSQTELKQARTLLMAFISGEDRSLKFVNSMEVFFDDLFPDDDDFQDFVVSCASYSPEVGRAFFGEQEMLASCKSTLFRVDRLLAEAAGS